MSTRVKRDGKGNIYLCDPITVCLSTLNTKKFWIFSCKFLHELWYPFAALADLNSARI